MPDYYVTVKSTEPNYGTIIIKADNESEATAVAVEMAKDEIAHANLDWTHCEAEIEADDVKVVTNVRELIEEHFFNLEYFDLDN